MIDADSIVEPGFFDRCERALSTGARALQARSEAAIDRGLVAQATIASFAIQGVTLPRGRDRLGLSPQDTLAAGDGANDLAMIEAAGLGVAYHAKPKVAEAAHARIDHGDLTALLYLQGYARADFIEA